MDNHLLGYSERDLKESPYAPFYEPRLAPLQDHVTEALHLRGQAEALFHAVAQAPRMLDPGYGTVETGYTRGQDLSIRVFCLTPMPRVTPAMWDWWFGWHGCEALRYKLWHPAAHVEARWADGGSEESYVGRTSLITEYLGPQLKKAAVSFLSPRVLGFDEERLAAQGEVVVCARVGIPGTPVQGGWLLHQIRPLEGGSEMRSRMWFGGANAAIGNDPGVIAKSLSWLLRPATKMLLPDPAELLVHNAQEMAHLAGFLPELYAAFGPKTAGSP